MESDDPSKEGDGLSLPTTLDIADPGANNDDNNNSTTPGGGFEHNDDFSHKMSQEGSNNNGAGGIGAGIGDDYEFHDSYFTNNGGDQQTRSSQLQGNDEEGSVEYQHRRKRRNMIIVSMLLVFLAIAGAIGAVVGIAFKNNEEEDINLVTEGDGATGGGVVGGGGGSGEPDITNDYGGIGGGIDTDDRFVSTPAPTLSPSASRPCYPIEIGIVFDEYSGENSFELTKGDQSYTQSGYSAEIIWQSDYFYLSDYAYGSDTFTKCFPEGTYTFTFLDREGDGICCDHGEGMFVLTSQGRVILHGGEEQEKEVSVSFSLPYVEPAMVDEDGDGLDDRTGWVITPLDDEDDCEPFHLEIDTDAYGLETSWELYSGISDVLGTLIANGGPYGSNHTYIFDYCLPSPQNYVLYMYDWQDDGMCCDNGEGKYEVSSGDIVIRSSSGIFTNVETTPFVLPADGSIVFTSEPTPAPSVPTTPVPTGGRPKKKTLFPTQSPVTSEPTMPRPTSSPVNITNAPTFAMGDIITSTPMLSPVTSVVEDSNSSSSPTISNGPSSSPSISSGSTITWIPTENVKNLPTLSPVIGEMDSSQPSSQLSSQPSSLESSQPSSLESSQPSSLESSQPSSLESSQPSSFTSTSPSLAPSLNIESPTNDIEM